MTHKDLVALTRLDKPIGILLLLWPTLWGLWFAAEGTPDLKTLLIFTLGVVFMRSAGCVINDVADRKIDPHVARTENRPIAAGRVSVSEALVLFAILVVGSFALVLQTNMLTIMLSPIAVALAVIYPFTKRYINAPQVILGIAFGFAVPMAFAAITNNLPILAWWLLGLTAIWAVAYDTLYAMVDREDDLKIGVKSTAILFGKYDVAIVNLLHGFLFINFLVIGLQQQLSWPYYVGVVLAACIAVYQYGLFRTRERGKCFKAFLISHYVGAFVFLGIVVAGSALSSY